MLADPRRRRRSPAKDRVPRRAREVRRPSAQSCEALAKQLATLAERPGSRRSLTQRRRQALARDAGKDLARAARRPSRSLARTTTGATSCREMAKDLAGRRAGGAREARGGARARSSTPRARASSRSARRRTSRRSHATVEAARRTRAAATTDRPPRRLPKDGAFATRLAARGEQPRSTRCSSAWSLRRRRAACS